MAATPGAKSVWDGSYTAEQAERGRGWYLDDCSMCHREDLAGYNNILLGVRFMDRWREDNVESFFSVVKKTMPRGRPGGLPDAKYLDIVAFVLKMNGFPAGDEELKMDNIASVRIQARTGPDAVPDFALVEVVGCLAPGAAKDEWSLTRATEPVRTRTPDDSTAEELKTADAKPLGSHSFVMMDIASVRGAPVTGKKFEAKGFLIRKTEGDKINLTSLRPTGGNCGQ